MEESVGRHAAKWRLEIALLAVAVTGRDVRSLTIEIGPDRIVGLTEEGGIGSGTDVHVSLRVEQPGQTDIARHRRQTHAGPLLLQEVHYRADERPVPWIARPGLQSRRVGWDAADRVGHAMLRIR